MTSDLLQDIPAAISSRLERELSNGTETLSPDLLEKLTREQQITLILVKQLEVREREAEKTRVIMRTLKLIAVFSALVIAYLFSGTPTAQTLHEILEVFFNQSAAAG